MPRYVKGKLHIDTVEIPGVPGVLGMCSCPGSGYLWGSTSNEERGVEADLDTLKDWGGRIDPDTRYVVETHAYPRHVGSQQEF